MLLEVARVTHSTRFYTSGTFTHPESCGDRLWERLQAGVSCLLGIVLHCELGFSGCESRMGLEPVGGIIRVGTEGASGHQCTPTPGLAP